MRFNGRNDIRCPQQLSFLKFWERQRVGRQLPSLSTLVTDEIRRVFDKLMLCEVIRDGDGIRFLTRLHGKQYERVHGTALIGRHVDETVPAALRADALPRYREVASTGVPDFSLLLLQEGDGPIVQYERLLLPFSRDGSQVNYICCLVTMVTEANGFDIRIVLKGQICKSIAEHDAATA